MSHKAYAFNWEAFTKDDVHDVLLRALESNDHTALVRYCRDQRARLRDPYEGQPLPPDWEGALENRDVHEYGDYALTRFYNPAEDRGLGEQWASVSSALSGGQRAALLGTPLGPPANLFDPGRQGSYFQTPVDVVRSHRKIRESRPPVASLEAFEAFLQSCESQNSGLYVTF